MLHGRKRLPFVLVSTLFNLTLLLLSRTQTGPRPVVRFFSGALLSLYRYTFLIPLRSVLTVNRAKAANVREFPVKSIRFPYNDQKHTFGWGLCWLVCGTETETNFVILCFKQIVMLSAVTGYCQFFRFVCACIFVPSCVRVRFYPPHISF